jgi:predicted nucleotidyltransferase
VKKTYAFVAAILTLLLVSTACAPAAQPPATPEGSGIPEQAAPSPSGTSGAEEPASPAEAAGVEAVVVSEGPSDPNVLLLISDEADDITDFSELSAVISGVGFVMGDGEGIIEETFEPVAVNLVDLTGEAAIALWEGYVPEGDYTKVFLYVDEVWGVLVDPEGETIEIKLPSNKLQLDVPVHIEEGEPIDFVFDISVHSAGKSGQYILKPQLTESGQGMLYRINEQAQERLHTGRPDWAGKQGDDDEDDEDDEDEDDQDDEDDEDEGRPGIDVETDAEAVEGAVTSTVTIENDSDVDVTVLTVTSTIYWQVRGNDWEYLEELVDDAGYAIAAGDTLPLEYEIPCDVPEEARELRYVVEVVIDGRDKTFRDTESFEPWGLASEIEFEGTIDSLDPLTISTGEGVSYEVVVDDETEVEGELAVGGEVEVEGILRADGTVLAFEIEGEEGDD